ncbi:thioesterase [Frankia sp. AgB1.9]|uniref:thioesterase domain-containing protein n=1 Tax=Frankia sp. AgB1.9 TaxID=1836968 RepID=UPI001931B8CE|nr:thioesterase domain-containing protein [Frankia sp. AgB1.9]MBL7547937.1 thioesterase [Frankia sp. AgB1.9]
MSRAHLGGRGDRRPPLFFVGGLEGPPHPGQPLAGALIDTMPCRGLDLPGRDGARPPLDDVRAMASYFLPGVLLVQPWGGPFQLAGYGFGGILAYELGRLLRGIGQPVAPVILFDTALPRPGQPPPRPNPQLAIRELARMRHLPCLWQGTCRCGIDHGVPLSEQGARIARALGARDPARYEDYLLASISTYTAALRAYAAYRPGPSDLPVVLARPADRTSNWGLPSQLALYDSRCLGWERAPVAELHLAVTPTDRGSFFADPHHWDLANLVHRHLATPTPPPPPGPTPSSPRLSSPPLASPPLASPPLASPSLAGLPLYGLPPAGPPPRTPQPTTEPGERTVSIP